MLVLEGGLVIVALLLGAIFGVEPLATLRLDVGDVAVGAIATVPMAAILGLLWSTDASFVRDIRAKVEVVVASMFGDAGLANIALVCIAAGLGEEALFRGFLQGGLEQRLGTWSGLAAASAVFGLAHPVTPAYVTLAALIGVYLGGLWIWSGNLLVPVIAHALYDFVAVVTLLRRRRAEQQRPLPR